MRSRPVHGERSPRREAIRIVSTDVGIDDAFALLFLDHFAEPSVDYVIATGGNVKVARVAANCAFLKEQFGLGACLFAGSDPPDLDALEDAAHVHGPFGLGPYESPAAELPPMSELVALLRGRTEHIRLLVLGPATDAAHLLADPDVAGRVEQVVLMGGAFEPRGGRLGNVTPFAEFNFWMDPAAAWSVMQAAGRCTLVPLDATERVLFGPDELLARVGTGRHGTIARALIGFLRHAHVALGSGDGVYLHDVLAAAVWLDQVRCERREVSLRGVVPDGERRGMVLRDGAGGTTVNYVAGVDEGEFLLLWSAMARAMLA